MKRAGIVSLCVAILSLFTVTYINAATVTGSAFKENASDHTGIMVTLEDTLAVPSTGMWSAAFLAVVLGILLMTIGRKRVGVLLLLIAIIGLAGLVYAAVMAQDTTGSTGTYTLSNVPAGIYSLRGTASGYYPCVVEPFVVSTSDRTAPDMILLEMPETPTSTPIPTSTPLPPTETPNPTETPVPPTDTPIPTNTPVPPTETPIPPTSTPIPTDTPLPPTNTPLPTDTPVPPTETPVPTDTPESTNTSVPTQTPIPTETPIQPTPTPTSDGQPPFVTRQYPAPGVSDIPRNTRINFHLEDLGSGVDLSTILLSVEGSYATDYDLLGDASDYQIVYSQQFGFFYGQVVNIEIDAADLLSNVMPQVVYSFTVEDYVEPPPTATPSETNPPVFERHDPAKDATDVPADTNITLHVVDTGTGVDITTIALYVQGVLVTPSIFGDLPDYNIIYNPQTDFGFGEIVGVFIRAEDFENNLGSDGYSFTIAEELKE